MSIILPLTRGVQALIDESCVALASFRWNAMPRSDGNGFYAKRAWPRGHTTYLHRAVLELVDVEISGLQVDHVNGDTLDCRVENLRTATATENNWNRVKLKRRSSSHKGVSAFRGGWKAQIRVGGRVLYLGLFAGEETAARAYDAAALKVHGAFARLNFPES